MTYKRRYTKRKDFLKSGEWILIGVLTFFALIKMGVPAVAFASIQPKSTAIITFQHNLDYSDLEL